MRKKRSKGIRFFSGLLLTAALIVSCAAVGSAADLHSLLEETEGLEEYLRQLTTTITTLTLKQEYIQEEIDEAQNRLEENQALLSETQEACDQQYVLMKKRIQYLYESGDTNYLEAILSSESIGDILNRFEYIHNIVGYDRDMLDKYQDLVDTVNRLQEELLEKKAQLEELQEKAQENLEEASGVTNTVASEITDYGIEAQDAGAVVQEYMDAYGDEIRADIEQEIENRQQENPDINWYEEPWTEEPEIPETETTAEPVGEDPITETETETTTTKEPVTEPETTTTQEETTTEPETTTAQEETTTEPETTTAQEETTTEPEATTTQEETTTEEETTSLVEIVIGPTTSEPETAEEDTEPETSEEWIEPETTQEWVDDSGDDNGYVDDSGYSDAYLIACLVSGEVGYESYQTQWAVADLIMNLVESPSYPGTVYGVLHCGAFDAVYWTYIPGTSVPSYLYYIANGPMDSALSAAYDAIGNRGASHGYTSYCADWFYESNPGLFENCVGEIIGEEYFYNYIW